MVGSGVRIKPQNKYQVCDLRYWEALQFKKRAIQKYLPHQA